jgi:precorrin-3B C17-methyltransferase
MMGTLHLVGLGPGDPAGLTQAASAALAAADVIVGYKRYIQLVRPLYPDKEYFATGMTHEVDRCTEALTLAAAGRAVALVCSGDPGIYGMASLVYELAEDFPEVAIVPVPGVTAATSGAALLGAPLGHDFAVISLSDRLTPWELIEWRLECAALGDLCLSLYNPSSHGRPDHLRRACAVLLRHRSPETPCGTARAIGRTGQATAVMTLAELAEVEADMLTTVFVGNSQTRLIGGRLVTPRGYPGV